MPQPALTMPDEVDERSQLLPGPNGSDTPITTSKRYNALWRQYALYALLVTIGLGVGIGATLALDNHPHVDDDGPMVPPIYELPPVSSFKIERI